jgi:type I restriction enzyme S subunit
MTDGLKPEHRQAIIETLAANPKVERIVLFGSRATGTFTLTSDVDLALFGDDLTLSDQAALAEAVAELSVPQRVDILIYHRIESQALREEIRKHGVEWFARERATQAVNTAGDWQELPFSQAVIVNPRVHLKRGEIYSFVDMNAIIAGRRSAYASEQRRFNGGGSRFAAGDTLMARITPCLENGKIARFAGRPGEVAHGSTEFIVIRGRDGVSDTSYAYYLTKWDGVSGYAISQMTGTSGRQRVPPEALDHLTVPLPPLPEQRAIAHILGTLDDKIELNRRMSETLEAMARALFKAWFVDFEPVRAKLAGRWQRGQSLPGLPAHLYDLFPDRLVDSELGEIPEGWKVGTLGNVAENPRRSVQPNSIPPDTPYIALEHMPRRCIALSDWGTAEGIESNKFEFRKGEILFGKLRPYFHKVGVAPVDGVCSTDIVVVCPRTPHWFAFVLCVVSSDDFVEFTNAGSTGTKMPRTSWADMARYEIALPPDALAQAFNAIVRRQVDRLIAAVHESRTLAALRDALLPKLISGEIRVKDAERFLKERGL